MRRASIVVVLTLLTAPLGCEGGGPSRSASGAGGGDAGVECVDGAACCAVPSMLTSYPGAFPNMPYGPQPEADACVSREHDVILVLGCPNEADGAPSECQVKRADLAISLMTAGYGSRFITSGGAVHNMYVEADTLRDLLVARGATPEDIRTEPLAEHTDENIYHSSKIMQAEGWSSAIVVSDDPGHLILTAVCDSNCCVDLGRLTIFAFATQGGPIVAGHYALHPSAQPISDAECAQIEQGSKFMCVNLATRRACADDLQL